MPLLCGLVFFGLVSISHAMHYKRKVHVNHEQRNGSVKLVRWSHKLSCTAQIQSLCYDGTRRGHFLKVKANYPKHDSTLSQACPVFDFFKTRFALLFKVLLDTATTNLQQLRCLP